MQTAAASVDKQLKPLQKSASTLVDVSVIVAPSVAPNSFVLTVIVVVSKRMGNAF